MVGGHRPHGSKIIKIAMPFALAQKGMITSKKVKMKPGYIFKVNDDDEDTFHNFLDQFLNKEVYKFKKRGNGYYLFHNGRYLDYITGTVTRNIIKQLIRVCSDDENFADLKTKLECLYISKVLLGEE